MLPVMQFLAALCCALFAGAAVYVTLVEHPARMSEGTRIATRLFAPSYTRGATMQGSLAGASFLFAIIAAAMGGGAMWFIGALLIGGVIPFTIIAILPTNKALLATDPEEASTETGDLLAKWGQLHAVRSVLSLLATALFLALLV